MEACLNVPLLAGELQINSWDLYYTVSEEMSFFGKATITNKRIFFETRIKGAIKALFDSSPFFTNHIPGVVVLSKNLIRNIEAEQKALSNKVVMTLNNDQKHILDRKLLSIDKLIEALEKV